MEQREPCHAAHRTDGALLDHVEVGAEAAPQLRAIQALRARQPPGRRRPGNASQIEIGTWARDGGDLGRVRVAERGRDGVVAADVDQQVERAGDSGLAKAAHVTDQELHRYASAARPRPGRLDRLRDEVDTDHLPAQFGEGDRVGTGPTAEIERSSRRAVEHELAQLGLRLTGVPLRATDPDTLMRFLLDGLHGALLPLLHEGRPHRRRVVASLNEVVRRFLSRAY